MKGKSFFEKLKKDIFIHKVNLISYYTYNPSANTSCRPNKKRNQFFKDLNTYGFEYVAYKYSQTHLIERITILIKDSKLIRLVIKLLRRKQR